MMSKLARDWSRHTGNPAGFSPVRLVSLAARDLGFRSVVILRLQAAAWERGGYWRFIAAILRNINIRRCGLDMQSGARIAAGLVVRHPNGIVIGHGAVVGGDCTILQQVTLGERRILAGSPACYPTIGDAVIIGAGAKVLGNIEIGPNSTVGANAVVISDVPESHLAVGNPARVLPR